MKKFLFLVLLISLFVSSYAQQTGVSAASPDAQKMLSDEGYKVIVDDVAKLTTPEDLVKIKKYALHLRRQTGVNLHFATGYQKGISPEELSRKLIAMFHKNPHATDNEGLIFVLVNPKAPQEPPVVHLYVGKDVKDREKLLARMPRLKEYINKKQADAIAAKVALPLSEPMTTLYSNLAYTVLESHGKLKKQQDAAAAATKLATDMAANTMAKTTTASTTTSTNTAETAKNGAALPPVTAPYEGLYPPKPSSKLYVVDHANLLTPEDAAKLSALGRQLDERSTAELVIVTVPTRGDIPVGDFALKIGRDWGIGKKDKNNGCILVAVRDNLLARKKGKLSIKTGYGLEGCLPDGKCGNFMDNIALPPFNAKEQDPVAMSAGLRDTYIALAAEIAMEYGVELDLVSTVNVEMPAKPENMTAVADMAQLLTGADKQAMEAMAKELAEHGAGKLCFVSCEALPRLSWTACAKQLASEWKLFDNADDGVLILVNHRRMKSHDRGFIHLQVGKKFAGKLSKDIVGKVFSEITEIGSLKDEKVQQDKEEVSSKLRDTFQFAAQEMATVGGFELTVDKKVSLPNETVSALLMFVGFILFIVLMAWNPCILFFPLLAPILIPCLFFKKGRAFIVDLWNTKTSSSSGGYSSHSSSYDSGYSSSSSSSSSSYGGGSFGGGGADR